MDRDQAQGRVTTSRDAHTQPEGVCARQAADPYGTSILTVGQRVFGLTDWTRNGSLAQYAAVEARNLAPLPADVDHITAAALPISGLIAWQALFDHAHLMTGQSVLIHGAAGGVGSIAVQLAHEVGARVIGTGWAGARDTALGLGADAFVYLQAEKLEGASPIVPVVLNRSFPHCRLLSCRRTVLCALFGRGVALRSRAGRRAGLVGSVSGGVRCRVVCGQAR